MCMSHSPGGTGLSPRAGCCGQHCFGYGGADTCESLLPGFWGRYSEGEWLERMVSAFLIFQGPATLFSRTPFFRNLSFVPRSASLPPPQLLLLCFPFCPLCSAHQGPFLSLCQNAWPPGRDLGSSLLSDLQSHPGCLHSL